MFDERFYKRKSDFRIAGRRRSAADASPVPLAAAVSLAASCLDAITSAAWFQRPAFSVVPLEPWPPWTARYGGPACRGRRLIANLKLEFVANPKKPRRCKFLIANIPRFLGSIGQCEVPPVITALRSNFQPPASNLKFLIGTLDISEFESTRSKQSRRQNSNR